MTHPIPSAALDDRLFFGGTSGSGKTYGAGTAVERLLGTTARVCIPDPLGVWYGLALRADGKTPSVFREKEKLVIFGGPHGDLPLTEHSGALIGETVAGMAESCILDLSELKTGAAERRFMLAFLTALYNNKTREPLHVVFDEADLWAPQRVLDKEGEAMKLLGMMENICRRGRVKGFIPWLISQRPAVISKNVLSQIDGMIAFKLTSVQDRDAIGDWVQGQADKKEWERIWSDMPTLERGTGLVWLPARGILKTAAFPAKVTFDSSRAPKRGERVSERTLKPINLDRLKDRLAKVDAEAKANDPKKLRAETAKLVAEKAALERQLAAAASAKPAADPDAIKKAEERGFEQAKKKLENASKRALIKAKREALTTVATELAKFAAIVGEAIKNFDVEDKSLAIEFTPAPDTFGRPVTFKPPRPAPLQPRTPSYTKPVSPSAVPRQAPPDGALEKPLQRIVDAIRWWNVFGIYEPTHQQVAFIAGYVAGSGTWNRYLSALRSAALLEPKGPLILTDAGAGASQPPPENPTAEALRAAVTDKIDAPLRKILQPLLDAYPQQLPHDDVAVQAGYVAGSGTWNRYLSALRSLDLIEPKGPLKAQDWLFPLRAAA